MQTTRRGLKFLGTAIHKPEDLELLNEMNKEFQALGVGYDSKLSRSLMDFVQMRANFMIYRKLQSQRKLQTKLNSRLNLIKSALDQVQKDKGYFDNRFTQEFINRHLFVALIEKAILISDELNKKKPQDTLTFSFHLWNFKQALTQKKIHKPVEVIAHILEKTNAIEGIGGGWSSRTISNKISKAQELIALSKKYGACHEPRFTGESPKAESFHFIQSLSNGCDDCMKAWEKVFKIKKMKETAIQKAGKDISKEFPELKRIVFEIENRIKTMPLSELLDRIPKSLRGVISFVTR